MHRKWRGITHTRVDTLTIGGYIRSINRTGANNRVTPDKYLVDRELSEKIYIVWTSLVPALLRGNKLGVECQKNIWSTAFRKRSCFDILTVVPTYWLCFLLFLALTVHGILLFCFCIVVV